MDCGERALCKSLIYDASRVKRALSWYNDDHHGESRELSADSTAYVAADTIHHFRGSTDLLLDR